MSNAGATTPDAGRRPRRRRRSWWRAALLPAGLGVGVWVFCFGVWLLLDYGAAYRWQPAKASSLPQSEKAELIPVGAGCTEATLLEGGLLQAHCGAVRYTLPLAYIRFPVAGTPLAAAADKLFTSLRSKESDGTPDKTARPCMMLMIVNANAGTGQTSSASPRRHAWTCDFEEMPRGITPQASMVVAGLAAVDRLVACADQRYASEACNGLLAHEADARTARRGLWWDGMGNRTEALMPSLLLNSFSTSNRDPIAERMRRDVAAQNEPTVEANRLQTFGAALTGVVPLVLGISVAVWYLREGDPTKLAEREEKAAADEKSLREFADSVRSLGFALNQAFEHRPTDGLIESIPEEVKRYFPNMKDDLQKLKEHKTEGSFTTARNRIASRVEQKINSL